MNGEAPRGLSATVLVAEDDDALRTSLEKVLRFEGYKVLTAADGAEALEIVATDEPDAAVLDVNMPHVDGLAACRLLRQKGNRLPVLLLTARHTVADRVEGLDAGADDYLVKPFAVDELLARVRALLRRPAVAATEDALTVADLRVEPATRQVQRAGRTVELTKLEFDLLELLVRNAGVVLSRELLYERIWGYDFDTDSKSLDVYIGYLRRKTEEGGEARLVHTVRGVGYVVREL